MSLTHAPVTLRSANEMVRRLHRHADPVRGHFWSIAAYANGELVGCATVGRPNARMSQDGTTAVVTRLVADGTPHVCSMLYGACWRAWRAMGGIRMFTYTRPWEPGTSLVAAGWKFDGMADSAEWDRPNRRRAAATVQSKKLRWRAHDRERIGERPPPLEPAPRCEQWNQPALFVATPSMEARNEI